MGVPGRIVHGSVQMTKPEQAKHLIVELESFAKGLPSDKQADIRNAIYAIQRWLKDYERITGK